jgi:hypothetical protein
VKNTIFWDITPYSPLKANGHFEGKYRLHLLGQRISQARNQNESRWQANEAYFLTLMMEAMFFSGTSVDFQRTIQHYIPDDSFLPFIYG